MATALQVALLGITLAAILGTHALGITPERNWYNQFWWLDWILHFAGGAWVALMFTVSTRRARPISIISFVFAAGFLWEVLEYYYNIPFFGVGEASFSDSLWILDTLIDLGLDVGAAVLVAVFVDRYTRDNV